VNPLLLPDAVACAQQILCRPYTAATAWIALAAAAWTTPEGCRPDTARLKLRRTTWKTKNI